MKFSDLYPNFLLADLRVFIFDEHSQTFDERIKIFDERKKRFSVIFYCP